MIKQAQITKTFLTLAASVLLMGLTLPGCNSSAPKTENSENIPNDSVKNADTTYLKDMNTYKKQMTDTIAANNRTIAEFKEKIKREGKQVKSDYVKETDELEQKNRELKKKIDEYTAEGKDKWVAFKTGFSRDMDTLSKQIKKLTSKKTKGV